MLRVVQTDMDMLDAGYDVTPYITVQCDCGTVTSYSQDEPGHRWHDPVYCSNPECGKVIGKT